MYLIYYYYRYLGYRLNLNLKRKKGRKKETANKIHNNKCRKCNSYGNF